MAKQHRLADPWAAPEDQRKRGFLIRSALALVSTSFVTSGLGFIFWAVSARLFSPSNIGEASTAIAAMNILAPLTTMGLGTPLMSELPAMREGRAELVSTAAAVSGVCGGGLALICAMVLPQELLGLPGLGHDTAATLIFAAGVAAQAVGMMLD